MFAKSRRLRRTKKVRPGDGRALREYRIRDLFSRSLFFLQLADRTGDRHVYAVDVRHFVDEISGSEKGAEAPKESPAALFRDGIQIHRADLPTAFPVPGGVVEVAISMYGMKRVHYVPDDGGGERVLQPHRRSHEGLRAAFSRRFPRASAVIGGIAIVVLLASLALAVPQGLEMLTRIDFVAERIGAFTSPIHLPGWLNITVITAGVVAAVERALTLRSHWLIDFDTTWSALD